MHDQTVVFYSFQDEIFVFGDGIFTRWGHDDFIDAKRYAYGGSDKILHRTNSLAFETVHRPFIHRDIKPVTCS